MRFLTSRRPGVSSSRFVQAKYGLSRGARAGLALFLVQAVGRLSCIEIGLAAKPPSSLGYQSLYRFDGLIPPAIPGTGFRPINPPLGVTPNLA